MRWMCSWMLVCLLCGLYGQTALADPPMAGQPGEELIRDGDVVVFFGDSITQAGMYIDFFEAAVRCRFPDRKFRVFNRGISSETISGSSETDHQPRRPWAHERFTRDIVSLKPQVLIACFGMNDGNYHPFDASRFEQYQQGVRRLIERARLEAGVRTLILLTPPPFDPYQRKALDPAAKEFGYKYPAVDYDCTLGSYSEWLMTLREAGQPVVDLHTALNTHMQQRRQSQVSFTLIPDAIHPDVTGHWLMAVTLLKHLGLAEASPPQVITEPVTAAGWEGALPLGGLLPIPSAVDPESIAQELAAGNSLGGPRIRWENVVPATEWKLSVADLEVGTFSGAELRQGVAIPAQTELPAVKRQQLLLARIRERRELEYWQFRAGTDKPLSGKPPVADIPQRLQELDREIAGLSRGSEQIVRLQPVAVP